MRTAAIVVNWNSWLELDRCLNALENQSSPFQRILVIDNDSADSKPETVDKWQEKGRVEFLVLPSNVGFSKANNIGIEMVSDCDWVALVNPDAFLEPGWHQQMIGCVGAFPKAASYSSALVKANEMDCWDGLGDAYHISGLVWRIAHGDKRNSNILLEKQVFSPCAAAALYRREAVLEVGGFDEDYFCYVEDVDLGFRLRLMGYESVLNPQAVAYHVGSASTGGDGSDFSIYHGHRNLVWTFVKDMPGALFWVLLPLHIAMNLVTVGWFVLRGHGGVILRAKRDAIRGLPFVWPKRKAVQRTRQCSVGEIWRILDKRLFAKG